MQSFKRKCTNGNPFWEYIEVFLHGNTSMTPVDLVSKPRRPRITDLNFRPPTDLSSRLYTIESNHLCLRFFDSVDNKFSLSGSPGGIIRKFISINNHACIL